MFCNANLIAGSHIDSALTAVCSILKMNSAACTIHFFHIDHCLVSNYITVGFSMVVWNCISPGRIAVAGHRRIWYLI